MKSERTVRQLKSIHKLLTEGYNAEYFIVAFDPEIERVVFSTKKETGKWDDSVLEEILKAAVIRTVYGEAGKKRETSAVYSGQYDSVKNKDFVTGLASD